MATRRRDGALASHLPAGEVEEVVSHMERIQALLSRKEESRNGKA